MTAPVLTSLTPTTAEAGSAVIEVVISGSGFDTDCDLKVAGGTHGSNFVSATEIRADINPALLAPGDLLVSVVNGLDEESNVLVFTIIEAPITHDTLLDALKAGDTSGLATASDDELWAARSAYEQWAESLAAAFKEQALEVMKAIDHELHRRELI